LSCEQCETQIESAIDVPGFFGLPPDLMEFVMIFLRSRGNIRDVEKALGISYPTVCKRLDHVNELLELGGTKGIEGPYTRRSVLEQLEQGRISVKEATALLKGLK